MRTVTPGDGHSSALFMFYSKITCWSSTVPCAQLLVKLSWVVQYHSQLYPRFFTKQVLRTGTPTPSPAPAHPRAKKNTLHFHLHPDLRRPEMLVIPGPAHYFCAALATICLTTSAVKNRASSRENPATRNASNSSFVDFAIGIISPFTNGSGGISLILFLQQDFVVPHVLRVDHLRVIPCSPVLNLNPIARSGSLPDPPLALNPRASPQMVAAAVLARLGRPGGENSLAEDFFFFPAKLHSTRLSGTRYRNADPRAPAQDSRSDAQSPSQHGP